MRKRIVHRVDWRKHIIPNHHSWISEYMDTHGVEFYSRVADIVNESWKYHKPHCVVATFFRSPMSIVVNKVDYEDVLKWCLKWFENQEHYEYCAIVRDYIEERDRTRISKKIKKLLNSSKTITNIQ